jgi:four helix bundle protein
MNTGKDKITSFTKLDAWKEGHSLVLMVYKLVKNFPKEEIYSLTNQMCRSAVSITSNIAEGFSRQSYKEKVQFYYTAQGSVTELQNQLLIARDVGYLSTIEFKTVAQQSVIVHKIVSGLIKKSKTYLA